MKIDRIYLKINNLIDISVNEALYLYKYAPLSDLMFLANSIRKKYHPENKVTWFIDRNINITNACIANCLFCNFNCNPKDKNVYITSINQYIEKINELYKLGGTQILLQGGLHPKLSLKYYCDLFTELKKQFPDLKLHALGPPEIVHLANMEKKSFKEILISLTKAGLDSLPGAGAEILSDRVRKILSPAKCNTNQWLDVMREAHKLNLITSATMMFGHIETVRERIEHLDLLRQVQSEKPITSTGFISFIPWIFQDENTKLSIKMGVKNNVPPFEYIKMIAISRIMLLNISNIQPSWLTVGKDIAQICLHSGANDFGSIMIEENVVSKAGANYKFDSKEIQNAIQEAGFIPQFRNQEYKFIER